MNPARRLIFGSLAAMAVLVGLLFWRPANQTNAALDTPAPPERQPDRQRGDRREICQCTEDKFRDIVKGNFGDDWRSTDLIVKYCRLPKVTRKPLHSIDS